MDYLELAFWITLIALANSWLAILRAIFDPQWYQNQRRQAGLPVDLFDPKSGINSMIVTKLIISLPFIAFLWYLAQASGYV